MEIEAKFAVADATAFERLKAAAELAGYALAEAAGKEVRDTYLDTADRRIMAAGWFCRRRRRPGGLLITCKSRGAAEAGIHRREELEIALPREAPPGEWPAGEVRDLVLAAAGELPLEPIVQLRQTRLVRRALKDEKTVAEVSLDRVTVGGADGDLAPYFEVEAELVAGGTDDDLAAIAAALRDEWKLAPEPRSKFERALEALGIAAGDGTAATAARPAARPRRRRPPATTRASAAPAPVTPEPPLAPPRRPRRPGLRADDTMAEAARKTLRFHFRRMLDHEEGTRLGEDPDELHDMRVATRRMRATFRVFDAHLDPRVARPHVRGLRRTGRALGDVRDLDVFGEKTRAYLETLPAERRGDLEPLLELWRGRREAARERLLAYLDGGRYRAFVEGYGEFLETPGAGALPTLLDDGEALPARVGDVLPAALYERIAAVWAYDAPLAEADPPLTRFHRLRIAGKFLRYTLEFFEEALGSEAKPLIKSTRQLQDHLGDLQDAVVASNVLRNVLTWGTWDLPSRPSKAPLQTVVAPGVAAYLAVRQEELHSLVESFPQTWPLIRGQEFSRRLAEIVGELTARQPRRRRQPST